jgi:hypothetical protein
MTETKKAAISAAILNKIAAGMTVRAAVDSVLGAGTSEKLIAELYAAFTSVKS